MIRWKVIPAAQNLLGTARIVSLPHGDLFLTERWESDDGTFFGACRELKALPSGFQLRSCVGGGSARERFEQIIPIF